MGDYCANLSPHGPHEHYGTPATIRRECPGRQQDVNDGTRMVAALEAAGFTVAGRGRGYTRMGWPGSDPMAGSLRVPTDDSAPEFGELLDLVKAQLLAGARRGEAARHALDLHRTEVGQ